MATRQKYTGETDLVAFRLPVRIHELLKEKAERLDKTKTELTIRSLEAYFGLPPEDRWETIFD